MSKLIKLEPIVKEVLEENPEAREDDFVLITEVVNRVEPAVGHLQFNVVMLGHKTMKLPTLESITRCRRKLQNQYEELQSTKYLQKLRAKQEEEYREYARIN